MTGVWVGRGKYYLTTSKKSRTRLNITGALNLETMTLVTSEHQTIDGAAILSFRGAIREADPDTPRIHVVLDGAGDQKTISFFKR